jgi:hypothetical protein
MMGRRRAALRVEMTSRVSSFRLFSSIRSPKNMRSLSTSCLRIHHIYTKNPYAKEIYRVRTSAPAFVGREG